MGKSSPAPPPAPDYSAAAREQGAANEATARLQGRINNPNIYGPLGSQTVSWDGDQSTIRQTLTPDAQNALENQQRTQRDLSGLAQQGIGTAQRIMGSAFNPNLRGLQTDLGNQGEIDRGPNAGMFGLASGGGQYGQAQGVDEGRFGYAQGGPQAGNARTSFGADQAGYGPDAGQYGYQRGGVQGPNLQSSLDGSGRINEGPSGGQFGLARQGIAGPELQGQIDTSGDARMPVNAGMTGQEAIMSRLQPQIERQQRATAQQMANQGLVSGGEAFTNVMRDQSQQQNDLLSQAALQGINLDMAANQQGFGQAQARGQFGNQAQLSGFGADLQGAQLYNQGIQQNFGNELQAQQAQNQAQAQRFGQQVQSGQFGNQAQLASFGANLQNQQAQNQAAAMNFGQGQAAQQMMNQGIGQNYGQNLGAAQFANQGMGQNFAQGQAAAQAQNQAMQQNFQNQMASQQSQNQALAQNFGQGMQGQQMQNQAISQNFAQAQAAQQAQNAAQNQQYNQALQGAQFGNTAQQQSLAQQLQMRQQPLNEITGLMSGSQIQMPQFQGYAGSNIAPAPIFGAAQAQQQNAMDQYGIASSNVNAQNAGMYGLLGAGAGMFRFK